VPDHAAPGPLERLAGPPVATILGEIAVIRGGKAVHLHGAVHRARLRVSGADWAPSASILLSQPAEHACLVRFSRSVGLPRLLPDLLGMSIRVPHAYGRHRPQDLMLVTSADLPLVHHVFLPASDAQARPYSSSLPFRAGEDLFLIGALPHRVSPRPKGGTDLERLARAAVTGRLRFELAIAPVMGRLRAVATIEIGERLPRELDALRFDAWNCGGGLSPVGALNRMRSSAYPRSQAAWRRTRSGAARRQDEADRLVAELFP
jgi:hypothetical protein